MAITTHLVINRKIITKVTSLKQAKIMVLPPEVGSWKVTAIVCSTIFTLGTASQETPIGHVIYSVYDYMIKTITGESLDYNKTIQDHFNGVPKEEKVNSALEKCRCAFKDMH